MRHDTHDVVSDDDGSGPARGPGRRTVLAAVAGGLAGLVPLRSVLATAPAPALAAPTLDVQILQTASSLEILAAATYAAALAAPALAALTPAPARDAISTFAAEAQRRHDAHTSAFQAQTTVLDATAKVQESPNPKFLPLLTGADLSTAGSIIDLAAQIEKVAADTYVVNLGQLQDAKAKTLLGGVLGVGAQHLAALRLFAALLKGGAAQLVAIPFPLSAIMNLPGATAATVSPDALERVNGPDLLAEPTSGAVP